MTRSDDTISDATTHRPLPRSLIVGSTIAVFMVNLLILGYALYIHVPNPNGSKTTSPTAIGGDKDSRTGSSRTASSGLVSIRSGMTDSGLMESSADDDEDGDWFYEPVKVVNELDLPSLEEARPRYIQQCAACHGVEGRGNGPAADLLVPPPRDFVGSVFRYATSGSDREHIISDLERIITQGVPRSAMPGFGGVLPERQIAGLARYVFDIRERGDDLARPDDPVDVGARPPNTPALVARGKVLYTNLACNSCHGDSGRGDGMNAMALVDFQGRPVRPADFTSGLFKAGQAPEDLCRTVLRGVPGTPMVAYEAILTQDNDDDTVNTLDAWAVVAYIRSFAPHPSPTGAASGAVLNAVPAPDEAMLSDPSHVAWLGIEPTIVTMKPVQQRPEETTCVRIRVVRTADRIAICLDWHDRTPDVMPQSELYADAVSVMFGLGDGVPALPIGLGSGAAYQGDPVNIWYWRADRQYEATVGQQRPTNSTNDSTGDTWYLFVSGPDARVPRTDRADGSPGSGVDPTDQPRPATRAVLEANANDAGHVLPQPADGQATTSTAAWSNGLWRVVMVRPRATNDGADVQFDSSRRIPLSVAIWNGSKGDHDGVKLVSGWHWITFDG